ncbi:hypothetical protein MABM_00020 [Mycobacteroides abscessus]|nr:hypothetical protein MABM_00020 [Mycobacteroides abscessus]
MAAVALTPAASRPYVDNSTDNSEWTLAVGYNGLDRLLGGDSQGMGGGRGSGPGFSGTPGIFRLFQDTQADHIAWLLPTAFIALILGVIIAGKTPQTGGWLGRARAVTTNPAGAGLVLWGTWMVSNYVILSYMAKQFHPYYTSAMAPAIAGCLAIGTVLLGGTDPSGSARSGSVPSRSVPPSWHSCCYDGYRHGSPGCGGCC